MQAGLPYWAAFFATVALAFVLGVVIERVVVRPVELKSLLGFLVLEVEPRSPADVSSLLIGDVLVGEGGRRFESLQDLSVALARGGVARLQFQRGGGGATREVAVRLRGAAREAA